MGEIVLQSNLRWTMMASACLHAGVALLLAFRMTTVEHVVPIGVELLYVGEVTKSASAVVRSVVKPVVKQKREEQPAIKAEQEQVAPTASSPVVAGPAGRQDGAIVSALERYKYELRLFLESRKIYPETAKRLHQTGTVVVQFKVSAAGELTEVNLEQPSRSDILNRAAMDLVKRAPRFKPVPTEAKTNELKLSLPIEYIL